MVRAKSALALYGFVAWIATHVCYVLFLLWAYLPDRVLNNLGVTYYPDKHWALALPCHALVSFVSALTFYLTYNMMHVPPLDSLSTIVDEYYKLPEERDLGGRHRRRFPSLPPVCPGPACRLSCHRWLARLVHGSVGARRSDSGHG